MMEASHLVQPPTKWRGPSGITVAALGGSLLVYEFVRSAPEGRTAGAPLAPCVMPAAAKEATEAGAAAGAGAAAVLGAGEPAQVFGDGPSPSLPGCAGFVKGLAERRKQSRPCTRDRRGHLGQERSSDQYSLSRGAPTYTPHPIHRTYNDRRYREEGRGSLYMAVRTALYRSRLRRSGLGRKSHLRTTMSPDGNSYE